MKTIVATLTLLLSITTYAEGYKAPKLKVPKSSPKKAKVKKADMDDQNSFRVEEEFEADRDLASDEEMKLKWSESYQNDENAPKKKPESDERIIPWKMID